jgi:uncharacterized protein (DUF885 family)
VTNTGATVLRSAEAELVDGYLRRRPLTAAQLGDPSWSAQPLPVVASDTEDDLARQFREIRTHLGGIRADDLDTEDRLTLEMMTELSGYELDAIAARPNRYVVTPLPEAGLTSQLLLFLPEASIRSDADLETFARACAQIPQALDDSLAELAIGRAAGQHPVAHLTRRAVEQIEQYLSTPLAQDRYVLAASLAPCPAAARLAAGILAEVSNAIRPAFRRYCDALGAEVLPQARATDRPGLCWLPGGEQIYLSAVRQHTTLDVKPEQVHQVGLELVAQIRRSAEQVGASLGWPARFEQIRDRLRGDQTLYFTSAEQMLSAAGEAMGKALLAVPSWICDPPVAICEVREMNPLETRNGVLGHYQSAPLDRHRPGWYWLNTADPGSHPAYEAEALAHHESVPGHHIEISKSQEAKISSPFRRLAEVTPYREGWALYMERFADEIGLYSGPLARLGMLSFQLWRAGRLVVDTGMHQLGWSRDQAIGFLWDNTILTRRNVENEVDRYIACPGQALGYMTGQLAFEHLRSKLVSDSSSPAQNRSFHSSVLEHGPLTLGCLGRSVGVELAVLS